MQTKLLVFILCLNFSAYGADKLIEKSLTVAVENHDFRTTEFYTLAAQERSQNSKQLLDSQLILAEQLVNIAYDHSQRFGNKHILVDAGVSFVFTAIALAAATQPTTKNRDRILNGAALISAYYFLRTCTNQRAHKQLQEKCAILGLLYYLKNKKEKNS